MVSLVLEISSIRSPFSKPFIIVFLQKTVYFSIFFEFSSPFYFLFQARMKERKPSLYLRISLLILFLFLSCVTVTETAVTYTSKTKVPEKGECKSNYRSHPYSVTIFLICSTVCTRVLRASRDMAVKDGKGSVMDSFVRYCQLQSISVEDQKFCYDSDTIKGDIQRLLSLGANDDRICKKIKSINPDFCMTKAIGDKSYARKKGIIYI
jgi:hypothetical protein